MKKEKELNIFRAPNLDGLKSMYYKSKAYITDKISLDNETTLIVDAFRQLKDSETTKKTIRYFENELSIFKAPSIEVLKSLYFASTGIAFNKYSWELEVNNLKDTFRQYDNINHAKKSFVRMGKELKIFRKPSVSYNEKSIEEQENGTACIQWIPHSSNNTGSKSSSNSSH